MILFCCLYIRFKLILGFTNWVNCNFSNYDLKTTFFNKKNIIIMNFKEQQQSCTNLCAYDVSQFTTLKFHHMPIVTSEFTVHLQLFKKPIQDFLQKLYAVKKINIFYGPKKKKKNTSIYADWFDEPQRFVYIVNFQNLLKYINIFHFIQQIILYMTNTKCII